jgi:glycosyltransferase involved in cell wall biosynthesis
MRVAFITTEFVTEKYFSGGLANYINRVGQGLITFGHEVHVIAQAEKTEPEFLHHGIHVHRLGRSSLATHLASISWIPYILEFSVKAFLKTREIHRQREIDIVQFPNLDGCGIFTIKYLGVPHVLRLSGYRPAWNEAMKMEKRDRNSRFQEWIESRQLHLARNIFAPSELLAKILLTREGIRDVRVVRTPIFNNAEEGDPSIYEKLLGGRKYVLFIGRYEMNKGFHILVEALDTVLSAHRDLCVAFVGKDVSASMADSMTQYARERLAPFSERLVFIDQVPHAALFPIIQHSLFAVLPSLIDNLPNAALECMYHGKAVLGTEGASFDEFITDGVNGYLVRPGDAAMLAKKMNDILSGGNPDTVGLSARETAGRFSPENTIPELISYYREVIANERTKRE